LFLLAAGCAQTATGPGLSSLSVEPDRSLAVLDDITVTQQPVTPVLKPTSEQTISVTCRFIALPDGPTRADKAGDLKRLSEAEYKDLLGGKATRVLTSPRLLLASEQKAMCVVGSTLAYSDVEPAPDVQSAPAVKPMSRAYSTGLALELTVKAQGDQWVLTSFRARSCETLGVRTCKSRIGQQDVTWTEPSVLAGRIDLKEAVTFKPGENLVLPMAYTVRQAAGLARTMPLRGGIREEYQVVSKEAPVGRLVIAVLTIQLAEPQTQPAR